MPQLLVVIALSNTIPIVNEAIKAKFLDLKEGAIVVSLKPFVQSSRLSGRNVSDPRDLFAGISLTSYS